MHLKYLVSRIIFGKIVFPSRATHRLRWMSCYHLPISQPAHSHPARIVCIEHFGIFRCAEILPSTHHQFLPCIWIWKCSSAVPCHELAGRRIATHNNKQTKNNKNSSSTDFVDVERRSWKVYTARRKLWAFNFIAALYPLIITAKMKCSTFSSSLLMRTPTHTRRSCLARVRCKLLNLSTIPIETTTKKEAENVQRSTIARFMYSFSIGMIKFVRKNRSHTQRIYK